MNVSVFPHFCRTMEIHIYHVLGIVWIFTSCKICKKPWLCNVLFSHTFLVLSEFTFPIFWKQYDCCENYSDPIVNKTFMWNFLLKRLSYFESDPTSALCHRSTEIYILQKSRQCHVQQCFCNISMNMKIGIRLEIDPSGHT